MSALSLVTVLFAGLLAGEEFVVRWGVAPALARLPATDHLRARIALVHRLRVLVPALIVPTVLLAAASAVLEPVSAWGWIARGALLVFVLSSAFGTVPINMEVIGWDPENPPNGWHQVIARWEAIDVLRSSTAAAGFVLLLLAL